MVLALLVSILKSLEVIPFRDEVVHFEEHQFEWHAVTHQQLCWAQTIKWEWCSSIAVVRLWVSPAEVASLTSQLLFRGGSTNFSLGGGDGQAF